MGWGWRGPDGRPRLAAPDECAAARAEISVVDLRNQHRPALVAAMVAVLLLVGTAALIVLRAIAPSDGTVVDAGDSALPGGQVVLLTQLYEGRVATVLQLPARPSTLQEVEEQRRAAFVG